MDGTSIDTAVKAGESSLEFSNSELLSWSKPCTGELIICRENIQLLITTDFSFKILQKLSKNYPILAKLSGNIAFYNEKTRYILRGWG